MVFLSIVYLFFCWFIMFYYFYNNFYSFLILSEGLMVCFFCIFSYFIVHLFFSYSCVSLFLSIMVMGGSFGIGILISVIFNDSENFSSSAGIFF